jgi:hypothetical protein
MLHEVLFALLGHTGDIIICKDGRFAVAEDIPFAHVAEKALLNNIVNLGYYYQQLEAFTDRRFRVSATANDGRQVHMCEVSLIHITSPIRTSSLHWRGLHSSGVSRNDHTVRTNCFATRRIHSARNSSKHIKQRMRAHESHAYVCVHSVEFLTDTITR